MKKVFFAGSFNPFTKGHADIVERMLNLAESVVIGIGFNSEKEDSIAAANNRASQIRLLFDTPMHGGRVEVVCYEGLTALAARKAGCDAMVRGVRSATDFDYEYTLAAANRKVYGLETVLLPADPALSWISSSVVRDLMKYGSEEEVSELLPKNQSDLL